MDKLIHRSILYSTHQSKQDIFPQSAPPTFAYTWMSLPLTRSTSQQNYLSYRSLVKDLQPVWDGGDFSCPGAVGSLCLPDIPDLSLSFHPFVFHTQSHLVPFFTVYKTLSTNLTFHLHKCLWSNYCEPCFTGSLRRLMICPKINDSPMNSQALNLRALPLWTHYGPFSRVTSTGDLHHVSQTYINGNGRFGQKECEFQHLASLSSSLALSLTFSHIFPTTV